MNPSNALTIRRIALIEAATKNRALSAIALAEAIHICHQSTLDYLRYLLGTDPENGWQIHVEGWCEDKPQHRVALYRWGAGKNVPKPPRTSRVQLQRDFRERIRKDPVANALYLARCRALDAARRATKRPQTWCSALQL